MCGIDRWHYGTGELIVFISFEGIDGSGKSTQLVMLREWLEAKGLSVITVREPGATLLSESIREILLCTKQSITPTAELLLFSAARTQLVEKVIMPALEQGTFVLCDRFVDSTTAYQGYGRQLDQSHVIACNTIATLGVMPSITFFIDVPFEQAQQRMQFNSSMNELDRMERSGRDFFERVRGGYLAIAKGEPERFIVVDGLHERDEIHASIVKCMLEKAVRLLVLLAVLTITMKPAHAQTVVDAHQLFVPMHIKAAPTHVQHIGAPRSMMLQHEMARKVFEVEDASLSIKNFPLPGNESATLILHRTHAVVDADTKFVTNTASGPVAFTVRPVVSYLGTVNGDSLTRVTLHYSEGDIAGFVQHSSGQRTVIGRDFSLTRTAFETPHVIADEAVLFNSDPLASFICGNEEIPVDADAAARKASIPSVRKTVEGVQAEYLRTFKMAMVLREDIDSIMKRRGQTDEEIAQYFIKVAASIAQAYAQELNVYLTISYFEKFTTAKKSGYINDGRSPSGLLNEFSRDWSTRKGSVDRTVAHLYTTIRPSGGSFVGGVAYLDGLCDKNRGGGYGVSTMYLTTPNIPGSPDGANGFVWDVFVSAHEMGHNIGAYHTHSCYWSPPIDTCVLQSDGTDACLNDPSKRKVIDGTIMSYCHLLNGSRTPLTFGSRVASTMRGWIESSGCSPLVGATTIAITEPRGAEAFSLGELVTIRWVSYRISRVKILWGTSESGPWTTIASNINAADKQYVWRTTIPPITTFWLRIEDQANPNINDTSLAGFQITAPVRLDAPKGGERLGTGSAFAIRWTKASGIGNVKVEYSANGTTYTELAASSNTTAFAWTVPTTVTEVARIRVTAISTPSAPSTSGAFAIGVPRFTLEVPIENSFLCKNQPNLYRWNADFVPTIRIQYSTDNGSNWRTATQQSTIETSTGQNLSRNVNMNNVPSGTMVRLRAINSETAALLDSRNILRMDSCSTTSVDEYSGDVPFGITSAWPNPASTFVRLGISATAPITCDVVLVSAEGSEIVLHSATSILPGATTLQIPLQGVATGTYHIGLREGGSMVVAPIVVIR